MALQDILFEFLHHEIVAYFNEKQDKEKEDVSDLEYIGYSCGYRIVERLTKDWPRFKEELDMLKFLCTDFWSSIYKRQVDNLRTNHQGVYVLLDNDFRFFSRMSSGNQYLEHAPLYVTFTCGLVRGALANLGLNCVVSAEVHSLPACKFNIRVQKS
ncbi:trafficking protein particle complex subunit 6b-like [Planococcus citri]|uniref:trafficking protein particle complex subunit 6b-like n=1 Tax=Planococcus citri TaxID=170843 RepID=UPI0031F9E5DD